MMGVLAGLTVLSLAGNTPGSSARSPEAGPGQAGGRMTATTHVANPTRSPPIPIAPLIASARVTAAQTAVLAAPNRRVTDAATGLSYRLLSAPGSRDARGVLAHPGFHWSAARTRHATWPGRPTSAGTVVNCARATPALGQLPPAFPTRSGPNWSRSRWLVAEVTDPDYYALG